MKPFDVDNKLGLAVAVANAVIKFSNHASTIANLRDNNMLKDGEDFNDERILKESYNATLLYLPCYIKLAAIRALEISEADWLPEHDKELIAKSKMFKKAQ